MTDHLFGNLGGLMRGLSGLMPQDTPDGKLMSLQAQLSELREEETSLLAEIGRRALADDPGRFPEQEVQLAGIRSSLAAAEAGLKETQRAKENAEQVRRREEALLVCPRCCFQNPDGVKFCQECGAKLGPSVCRTCGAELAPGTRFCGTCGARQEG